MIRSLVTLLCALQASAPHLFAVDISKLTIGSPTTVAELDLGKLKGDLRQVGWSSDGTKLYVQTADGAAPNAKQRHYVFAVAGGAMNAVDASPDWAQEYWRFKSDRFAPGMESVMIDVEQKVENLKFGPGSAGAADRSSNGLGAENINAASNVEKAAESQHVNVVRLKVYDEVIGEFSNTQPIPGLTFGWGPDASGAIAFTNPDGQLILLDRSKHKRTVPGVHDAVLPAWSADGTRLAWAQKTARKKYTLVYADVK
jgi:hypothetical protein